MSDAQVARVEGSIQALTQMVVGLSDRIDRVLERSATNGEAVRRLDTEVMLGRERWHKLAEEVTAMRGDMGHNHDAVMGRIDRLVTELNQGSSSD